MTETGLIPTKVALRRPVAEAYRLGRVMGRRHLNADVDARLPRCPFILNGPSWVHHRLAIAWHRGFRELIPHPVPTDADRAEGAIPVDHDTTAVPQSAAEFSDGVHHAH